MRLDDFLLFTTIFTSAGIGILFPELCTNFQPYILYCMMLVLFLSFLRINFRSLLDTSAVALRRLCVLTFVKLIALPAVLYWITLLILPDYAVPVLLLSGISSGVVGPFIATLVNADVTQVLKMVIVTSLIVPFSLPPLVKMLAGSNMAIPIWEMIRLLAIVVFVPISAVMCVRRFFPNVPEKILARHFPISLVMFAIINLGVFSKYSDFFFQNPGQLGICLLVAYILSIIYYVSGFLVAWRRDHAEKLAAGISMGIMNNVLVIVFSSRFFGPLEPTLAALYMFPFFTMIVPLRLLKKTPQLVKRAHLQKP